MSWFENIERPRPEQLRRVGSQDWDMFVAAGARISATISCAIAAHFPPSDPPPRVLDLGCGVGRVFLPLYFSRCDFALAACDVDADAVSYLSRQVTAPVFISESEPPLPVPDGSFDCIYSVSLWTHVCPEAGRRWLEELRRVLRPGGLALVTTGGYTCVDSWRRRQKGWSESTPERLRRHGLLFREYDSYLKDPAAYPGIAGRYGLTAYDPHYIAASWCSTFEVQSIEEAVIDGVQDLVTMIRN